MIRAKVQFIYSVILLAVCLSSCSTYPEPKVTDGNYALIKGSKPSSGNSMKSILLPLGSRKEHIHISSVDGENVRVKNGGFGEGAYDLRVIPGNHTLEIYCDITIEGMSFYQIIKKTITLENDKVYQLYSSGTTCNIKEIESTSRK